MILGLIIVAIAAPVLAPYPDDVTEFHPAERLMGPSMQHFFGTDRMGSDIFFTDAFWRKDYHNNSGHSHWGFCANRRPHWIISRLL